MFAAPSGLPRDPVSAGSVPAPAPQMAQTAL